MILSSCFKEPRHTRGMANNNNNISKVCGLVIRRHIPRDCELYTNMYVRQDHGLYTSSYIPRS